MNDILRTFGGAEKLKIKAKSKGLVRFLSLASNCEQRLAAQIEESNY